MISTNSAIILTFRCLCDPTQTAPARCVDDSRNKLSSHTHIHTYRVPPSLKALVVLLAHQISNAATRRAQLLHRIKCAQGELEFLRHALCGNATDTREALDRLQVLHSGARADDRQYLQWNQMVNGGGGKVENAVWHAIAACSRLHCFCLDFVGAPALISPGHAPVEKASEGGPEAEGEKASAGGSSEAPSDGPVEVPMSTEKLGELTADAVASVDQLAVALCADELCGLTSLSTGPSPFLHCNADRRRPSRAGGEDSDAAGAGAGPGAKGGGGGARSARAPLRPSWIKGVSLFVRTAAAWLPLMLQRTGQALVAHAAHTEGATEPPAPTGSSSGASVSTGSAMDSLKAVAATFARLRGARVPPP